MKISEFLEDLHRHYYVDVIDGKVVLLEIEEENGDE